MSSGSFHKVLTSQWKLFLLNYSHKNKRKASFSLMAIQLADIILHASSDDTGKELIADETLKAAKSTKAHGLWELGKLQASANGRHSYMASVKELME